MEADGRPRKLVKRNFQYVWSRGVSSLCLVLAHFRLVSNIGTASRDVAHLQREEAGGDAVRLLGESARVERADDHFSSLLH